MRWEMFNWLNEYRKASAQTHYFFLTLAVYGIAMLVTTVYVYARLDYVRSYKTNPTTTHPQSNYDSSTPRVLQK